MRLLAKSTVKTLPVFRHPMASRGVNSYFYPASGEEPDILTNFFGILFKLRLIVHRLPDSLASQLVG
jgi:hypothetical protein